MEDITQQLAVVSDNIAEVQARISQATVELQKELSNYQALDLELRKQIVLAMEETNTKSFENDFVKLVLIAPQVRTGVDLDKLRSMHPDVAEQCKKITNVKSSVRITIK